MVTADIAQGAVDREHREQLVCSLCHSTTVPLVDTRGIVVETGTRMATVGREVEIAKRRVGDGAEEEDKGKGEEEEDIPFHHGCHQISPPPSSFVSCLAPSSKTSPV